MVRILWISGVAVVLLAGCSGGKYDSLSDASAADRAGAEKLWTDYLKALDAPGVSKDPLLAAVHFSRAVLQATEEAEFGKHLHAALKRKTALDSVKIKAVKNAPGGLLLVVDSKAGEAGIPVVKDGDAVRFAELNAATGDWTAEAKPIPAGTAEPSLLSVKVLLRDEQAPVGERLKAAVSLAGGRHRQVIVSSQGTVSHPVVRLGLGLARVKLDGFDESFLRNFPIEANGLKAVQQADPAIFEEMITKVSNLGAMVEDPPANEVMFKVAAGAPSEMRDRMAKAVYDMAELGPVRFANAVKNLVKDVNADPVMVMYLEEVKRRGGAPKLNAFLNKFASEGEAQERALCQRILRALRLAK